MPLLTDDHRSMIHELDDCGKLSDWEVEFIDSMLKKLDAIDSGDEPGYLTDRQLAKLESMHWNRC